MGVIGYFPWQAEQFISLFDEDLVLRLVREQRVLNITFLDGQLEGRVFDFEGLAWECGIQFGTDEFVPHCSCGGKKGCSHSAALLLAAACEGLIPNAERLELEYLVSRVAGKRVGASSSRTRSGNSQRSSSQKQGNQLGLFDIDVPPSNSSKEDSKEAQRAVRNARHQTDKDDEADASKDQHVAHSDETAFARIDVDDEMQESGENFAPLLKIHGNSTGTAIEFWFRYDWGEVSWRDESQETRNAMGELRFVQRVRDIISGTLVFERGPYADLFKEAPSQDLQIAESPSEFLLHSGKALLEDGIEVRVENQRVRIDRELCFRIDSDLDLMGIQAAIRGKGRGGADGGILIRDSDLQQGMVQSDGEFVLLSNEDIRQLEYLKRRGMSAEGLLKASSINMVLLERIYQQISSDDRDQADSLMDMKRQLETPDEIPSYPVPQGLHATLRNYQQYGVNWMNFLLDSGVNPCLADDMGLGKTLQTLAVLQGRKERGHTGPNVLVCPVVTMANWEAECRKFAPDFQLLVHRGDQRTKVPEELLNADMVVVSYQTLRNDLQLFLEIEWELIVLDEAHYIKNIQSQLFKTVRSLNTRQRISLTGTPIENSVMELFAQMDFLNPGLLGSPRTFYADFFRGIQREGDENLLEELKDLVKPFLLRRSKEAVLQELPGKEIIVRHVEMTAAQRELYEFHRQNIISSLETSEDAQVRGAEVFKSLLTLRQIAVHPELADPAHRGVASAKIEALELILSDILSEDHKVLIFSQFLGTLEAISRLCNSKGWKHIQLTGKTQDRQAEVRKFQEDENLKVFLLSLKAGGVGINLTAADYVILFDPWWNPAAEQQAIDRAHRMGQTKSVFAYKLIVKDSIEEKILQMQEQKSNLADEIINSGGSVLSHLSREEMIKLFR